MAQVKENEKDGRMEDLDWKGGRAGELLLPFFLFSISFFQLISILQWQDRHIFHEIVRMNLPHLHIRSE